MRLLDLRRNEMLDSIRDNFNSGLIRVYAGTAPVSTETAIGAQTLLATLTMSATAFPAASGGVLTANAITGDSAADATGTASFVRVFESNGTTVICDLSVGVAASGKDVIFSTLSFVSGVAVNITSLTITAPAGSIA